MISLDISYGLCYLYLKYIDVQIPFRNTQKGERNMKTRVLVLVVVLAMVLGSVPASAQSVDGGNDIWVKTVGVTQPRHLFGVVGYENEVFVNNETLNSLRWVDYGDGTSQILMPGQRAVHTWTRSGEYKLRYYVFGGRYYRAKVPILRMETLEKVSAYGDRALNLGDASSRILALTADEVLLKQYGAGSGNPAWVEINGKVCTNLYIESSGTSGIGSNWELLYFDRMGARSLDIVVHAPENGKAVLTFERLHVFVLEERDWSTTSKSLW
ncbi:MAG: hypothetical protein ABIH88_00195 [Patescibacteria group bacterium]